MQNKRLTKFTNNLDPELILLKIVPPHQSVPVGDVTNKVDKSLLHLVTSLNLSEAVAELSALLTRRVFERPTPRRTCSPFPTYQWRSAYSSCKLVSEGLFVIDAKMGLLWPREVHRHPPVKTAASAQYFFQACGSCVE